MVLTPVKIHAPTWCVVAALWQAVDKGVRSVNRSLTSVALLVPDYDQAIAFFTTVMRFTLLEGVALGEGKRWVRVAPGGGRGAALVRGLAEQGRIAAMVRELAWQAGVLACDERDDGCTWTLAVERESLRSGSTPDRLAAALNADGGPLHRLVIEAGVPTDSVARRDAWDRQRRQAEAEQAIRDDPAVQELLGQFRTARIVLGSIRPT